MSVAAQGVWSWSLSQGSRSPRGKKGQARLSQRVPPGPPAVERVSLDLEDEEEEEDYMDKINPIYDALSYSGPPESYQGKGFVMSRAMYV